MLQTAPFNQEPNPSKRVVLCMEFFIDMFDNPLTLKSCLVGTTVQEVSETHPQLRTAARECFEQASGMFQSLLDEACSKAKRPPDTASLANLWVAGIQGSLILYKASQDPSVIRKNLEHMKQYIGGLLPE